MARQPSNNPSSLKVGCVTLLAILFLFGLVVLITWLVIKPKKPVYTIEEASANNFHSSDTHFSATFNFVIRAHNPSKKTSIYYDPINVSSTLDEELLASKTLCPFVQPPKNESRLQVNLRLHNKLLPDPLDAKAWNDSGKINIDEVILESRARLKVGSWKLKHRTLRVLCSPVNFTISSSNQFEAGKKCRTHLKV